MAVNVQVEVIECDCVSEVIYVPSETLKSVSILGHSMA